MPEPVEDYYLALGVARHTSAVGIRKAYLHKAQQVHPDHNPEDRDAELKMAELNRAYETLSDPIQRARYDAERYQAGLRRTKNNRSRGETAAYSMRYRRNHGPSLLSAFSDLVRRAVRLIAAILPV